MTPTVPATPAKPLWQRLAAPVLILLLLLAGYALGLDHYLTLQSIAEHRAMLQDYTSAHLLLSLLLFMMVYVLAVALSFPGAGVLSILGGLLFGWLLGALAAITSATLGATLLFQIVKTSLGDALVKRAGPRLGRINAGFKEDAFNYLLFLRLVPAFPFFLVNIAPALAGVKLRTFVASTVIGIIPGGFAFAFIGAGLDSLIAAQNTVHQACVAAKGAAACPFELSVASLVTWQLLTAFALLALVSLIPVVLKKWKRPAP